MLNARLRETTGRDDLALVHVLQLSEDERHVVETVDSVDPRHPRRDKTVIIISTQFGCPVGCPMCEAGGGYLGNLSADQLLAQVAFVLRQRPAILHSRKLKVHFARMGEPALNAAAVLEALERLPLTLPGRGLMPCIASVAPATSAGFFQELSWLKRRLYRDGRFQLQLSVNSTDPQVRQRLIPLPHLDLPALAHIGQRFFETGDRKVALNFALARGVPLDPELLREYFDPRCFMVKMTPINPTRRSGLAGLDTLLSAARPEAASALVARLTAVGFDVVVSIGEADEIAIGSNCGQLVRARAERSTLERGAQRAQNRGATAD